MNLTVPVALAGKPYEVLIGHGLIERAGALVRPLLEQSAIDYGKQKGITPRDCSKEG